MHATYRWAFVSRSGTAMAHTASATTTQHLQGTAIALHAATNKITQLLGCYVQLSCRASGTFIHRFRSDKQEMTRSNIYSVMLSL